MRKRWESDRPNVSVLTDAEMAFSYQKMSVFYQKGAFFYQNPSR
jgi:hypothetical protein